MLNDKYNEARNLIHQQTNELMVAINLLDTQLRNERRKLLDMQRYVDAARKLNEVNEELRSDVERLREWGRLKDRAKTSVELQRDASDRKVVELKAERNAWSDKVSTLSERLRVAEESNQRLREVLALGRLGLEQEAAKGERWDQMGR